MKQAMHDRFGSFASIPRCPSYVRLCSKTGRKSGHCTRAASPEEGASNDAAREEADDAPSHPSTRVVIILEHGDDQTGFPGRLAEGWFSVDRGQLTLTNAEGDVIAGRRLASNEDAAEVARSLLREMTEVKDAFNRALPYPKLHLA